MFTSRWLIMLAIYSAYKNLQVHTPTILVVNNPGVLDVVTMLL